MKITLEDMMGADAPIPPLRQVPPPPRGRSRGGFNSLFSRKPNLPAVPYRGPEAGSPPNIQ